LYWFTRQLFTTKNKEKKEQGEEIKVRKNAGARNALSRRYRIHAFTAKSGRVI